jgi:hypothetical protein
MRPKDLMVGISDKEYAGMSERERAEAHLAKVADEYKVWWQSLAVAGVWALLAIAHALERKVDR